MSLLRHVLAWVAHQVKVDARPARSPARLLHYGTRTDQTGVRARPARPPKAARTAGD